MYMSVCVCLFVYWPEAKQSMTFHIVCECKLGQRPSDHSHNTVCTCLTCKIFIMKPNNRWHTCKYPSYIHLFSNICLGICTYTHLHTHTHIYSFRKHIQVWPPHRHFNFIVSECHPTQSAGQIAKFLPEHWTAWFVPPCSCRLCFCVRVSVCLSSWHSYNSIQFYHWDKKPLA